MLTGEQRVNKSVNKSKAALVLNLLTIKRGLVNKLSTLPANIEFVRAWWNLGKEPNRSKGMIDRALSHPEEFSQTGMAAVYAFAAGLEGIPWRTTWADIRAALTPPCQGSGTRIKTPHRAS